MKTRLLLPAGFALLAACSSPSEPAPAQAPAADTTAQLPLLQHTKAYRLTDYPDQAPNVRNDTLLVYTMHDLHNGTFVMAARSVEEKREGLRLVLYKPRPDSSADVLAVSKPAYDSQVMLPTFFTTGDTADGIIILANYGGAESWGQNVFWLKDGRFKDLGWIDVSERGWKTDADSVQQWRTNIAPRTEVRGAGGKFDFTFTGDSVQLFDDQQGHQEVMFPVDRIRYRYDGTEMLLVIDGAPRKPMPL
jgi:hypothetical protein